MHLRISKPQTPPCLSPSATAERLQCKITKDDKPVGYKCPPLSTRFKPGHSGNPSGRPKKPKSLKAELIEELAEFTNVSEDGHPLQVSKSRAIAKSLVRAAVDGNMRATTALLSLFARDPLDADQTDETTPEERAVLDEYFDREVRRRRAAESSSEPSNEEEKD